jgi:hypothetical protein
MLYWPIITSFLLVEPLPADWLRRCALARKQAENDWNSADGVEMLRPMAFAASSTGATSALHAALHAGVFDKTSLAHSAQELQL